MEYVYHIYPIYIPYNNNYLCKIFTCSKSFTVSTGSILLEDMWETLYSRVYSFFSKATALVLYYCLWPSAALLDNLVTTFNHIVVVQLSISLSELLVYPVFWLGDVARIALAVSLTRFSTNLLWQWIFFPLIFVVFEDQFSFVLLLLIFLTHLAFDSMFLIFQSSQTHVTSSSYLLIVSHCLLCIELSYCLLTSKNILFTGMLLEGPIHSVFVGFSYIYQNMFQYVHTRPQMEFVKSSINVMRDLVLFILYGMLYLKYSKEIRLFLFDIKAVHSVLVLERTFFQLVQVCYLPLLVYHYYPPVSLAIQGPTGPEKNDVGSESSTVQGTEGIEATSNGATDDITFVKQDEVCAICLSELLTTPVNISNSGPMNSCSNVVADDGSSCKISSASATAVPVIKLVCGHMFHRQCILDMIATQKFNSSQTDGGEPLDEPIDIQQEGIHVMANGADNTVPTANAAAAVNVNYTPETDREFVLPNEQLPPVAEAAQAPQTQPTEPVRNPYPQACPLCRTKMFPVFSRKNRQPGFLRLLLTCCAGRNGKVENSENLSDTGSSAEASTGLKASAEPGIALNLGQINAKVMKQDVTDESSRDVATCVVTVEDSTVVVEDVKSVVNVHALEGKKDIVVEPSDHHSIDLGPKVESACGVPLEEGTMSSHPHEKHVRKAMATRSSMRKSISSLSKVSNILPKTTAVVEERSVPHGAWKAVGASLIAIRGSDCHEGNQDIQDVAMDISDEENNVKKMLQKRKRSKSSTKTSASTNDKPLQRKRNRTKTSST